MKLVINTQIRENYGDADQPFWKFKGGETYIVPNLTVEQVLKIKDKGIPTLTALIESNNPMFEEYVQNWAFLDDDAVVCEDWESPYILSWENNTWVCRQVQLNDGSFRRPVVSKIIRYTMGMAGERLDFECAYEIEDGRVVPYSEITEICRAQAA